MFLIYKDGGRAGLMSSCLCALPPTLRLKEAEGVREPLKSRIITTLVLHMHSVGGDEKNNFINRCQRPSVNPQEVQVCIFYTTMKIYQLFKRI